jgi:hypothetical protein
MGKVERIQVPSEDRERLGKLVKDRNTPQEIGWRSQIVLLAADGIGATEVAARVGKSLPQCAAGAVATRPRGWRGC